MSRKDEYARDAFHRIMDNHRSGARGARSLGTSSQRREQASPSRRSDEVRSHSKEDGQAVVELQEVWISPSQQIELALIKHRQKYNIIAEGFGILEAELQRTQGELNASEMVRIRIPLRHR